MASSLVYVFNAALNLVTMVLDARSARAVVYGVPIRWHLFLEGFLGVAFVILLSKKSYKPPKRSLTEQEIDELCDDWVPESLVPPITEDMKYEPPVFESAAGPHATVNGKEVLNFASANYLGLIGHEKLVESCTSAVEKYGVASCGPRGFYGTIEVHLDCETKISKFLGTPDSIIYSYGFSTMFSTIPCFCKKGDIIVADEGVHWGIQNGLQLSRSTIVYFKHNDMDSLRSTLEKLVTKNKRSKNLRRYLVAEAIYQNSGQIAPLDEIVKLKEKYWFRVILDESNSFGVLGPSGRGLSEHHGVPIEKIDVVTVAMGHALATEGGFCTGDARIIDYQRLSSTGYVFSNSLLPYLASAAITAIDVIDQNPDMLVKLKQNIALLWKELSGIKGMSLASSPESPIVFLKLDKSSVSEKNDLLLLQEMADRALKEDSVLVASSKRSFLDKCRLPLGIKVYVSAGHSVSDILKASESLKRLAAELKPPLD